MLARVVKNLNIEKFKVVGWTFWVWFHTMPSVKCTPKLEAPNAHLWQKLNIGSSVCRAAASNPSPNSENFPALALVWQHKHTQTFSRNYHRAFTAINIVFIQHTLALRNFSASLMQPRFDFFVAAQKLWLPLFFFFWLVAARCTTHCHSLHTLHQRCTQHTASLPVEQ